MLSAYMEVPFWNQVACNVHYTWAVLNHCELCPGWSECAYGWMSDFKGYWYHTTANGCGGGAGFRNGDYRTELGAYCCQRNPTKLVSICRQ